MSRRSVVWHMMSFLVLWGLWSCGQTPTDGGPRDPSEDLEPAFFARAPEPGFAAHTWRDSRAEPLTVVETVGPEGGMIEFRELGASIIFPKGALSERLTIEARAIAGPVVAFEFSPHGIEFDVPVQIRIDSERLTSGWSTDAESTDVLGTRQIMRRNLFKLIGVYYTGHEAGKGVVPLESLPMYFEDGDVVLEVHHFCGYAVASG